LYSTCPVLGLYLIVAHPAKTRQHNKQITLMAFTTFPFLKKQFYYYRPEHYNRKYRYYK
jgi:hypothetical protein